jgi:hypothetical protein
MATRSQDEDLSLETRGGLGRSWRQTSRARAAASAFMASKIELADCAVPAVCGELHRSAISIAVNVGS